MRKTDWYIWAYARIYAHINIVGGRALSASYRQCLAFPLRKEDFRRNIVHIYQADS